MSSETVGDGSVQPLISLPPAGARDPRPGLSGLPVTQLEAWLTERDQPAYRARQIADHVWAGAAQSTEELRTLPGPLRRELEESFRLTTLGPPDITPSDGGLTQKALHQLDDGRLIETVLMRYPARGWRKARATACISSQAGCAVGCPFCATGELGFWRDLEAAEIVDQVRVWRQWLAGVGQRLTNVVFMGMGEPLLNVERVLDAAAAITDRARFGLGARHVTISTSGVLPGIERMIAAGPTYTLAVSLHAARPELRDVLVPLNRRYPIAEVVAAAGRYAATTGRRVTYEYVMIEGINDTPGRRARGSESAARPARAHQSHPDEPGRTHALAAQPGVTRRSVRGNPARRQPGHDCAPQPRRGYRCGVRPAGGKSRRCAGSSRGGTAPGAARRAQRRGHQRRTPLAAIPRH